MATTTLCMADTCLGSSALYDRPCQWQLASCALPLNLISASCVASCLMLSRLQQLSGGLRHLAVGIPQNTACARSTWQGWACGLCLA